MARGYDGHRVFLSVPSQSDTVRAEGSGGAVIKGCYLFFFAVVVIQEALKLFSLQRTNLLNTKGPLALLSFQAACSPADLFYDI